MQDTANMENMNNNLEQPNNVKDKKGSLNKKIVIACLIIALLIITIIVLPYFKMNSGYAKMIESSINKKLAEFKEENAEFNYEPFTCSGTKTITCKSKLLEMKDDKIMPSIKDYYFTLNPSISTLEFTTKGVMNIKVNLSEYEEDKPYFFNINFDCTDNMELINEEDTYMKHNTMCKSSVDNINSEQKTIMYMQHPAFAEHNNMITFLQLLVEDSDKLFLILSDILEWKDFRIEAYESKVYSNNLFDDIVTLINKGLKLSGEEEVTKDEVIGYYKEATQLFRDELSFLGANDKEIEMFRNILRATDGVVYDGNNTISVSSKPNGHYRVYELFNMGYLHNFIEPNDYDINITSYK